MRLLAVLCLAGLCSSCGTVALMGGARTTHGRGLELATLVGVVAEGVPTPDAAPLTFNVQARYGLTDTFDVALRVFTSGVSLEGRYQIYAAPDEDRVSVNALIAHLVGGRTIGNLACFRCGSQALFVNQLRLLVGVRADWIELVVAPSLSITLPVLRTPLHGGGHVALLFHGFAGWSAGPEGSFSIPVVLGVATGPGLAPEGQIGLALFRSF